MSLMEDSKCPGVRKFVKGEFLTEHCQECSGNIAQMSYAGVMETEKKWDEARARREHLSRYSNDWPVLYCTRCQQDWPCDTVRALDALDEARRDIADYEAGHTELTNALAATAEERDRLAQRVADLERGNQENVVRALDAAKAITP